MNPTSLPKTLAVAFASMIFSAFFAFAAHPLIFNGVIHEITDTTVVLGETTFTMSSGCEILFEQDAGTVADVKAAMAINPRLVGVVRREAPESKNIVKLVVKAQKPQAPAPAAPGAQAPAGAAGTN